VFIALSIYQDMYILKIRKRHSQIPSRITKCLKDGQFILKIMTATRQ